MSIKCTGASVLGVSGHPIVIVERKFIIEHSAWGYKINN